MSWGLIPVITKQCGYKSEKSIINIPLNNKKRVIKILKKLQKETESKLKKFQFENTKLIKNFYNWNKFQSLIKKVVMGNLVKQHIKYKKNDIIFFKKNYKNSPNYHLNIEMIFMVLKSNLKILIKGLIQ